MNFIKDLNEVKKPGALILLILFVVVLYSNFLLTLFRVEFLQNLSENRKLSSLSEFIDSISLKSIKSSCDNFELYLNEHFAFRKPLVVMTNSLKYYLFKSSSDQVAMPAKSGWIYYGTKSMICDYKRTEHLSAKHINQIKLSLLQKEAWLLRNGIKFMFIIIPNKHNIYPQYMPAGLKKGSGASRGENLVKYLSRTMPSSTVDAFDLLRESALRNQVYYRIDTHWNHLGAKIVAEHVIDMLSESNTQFHFRKLPRMNEMTTIFTSGNFGRVMGVTLHEKEVIPIPQNGWSWHAAPVDNLQSILPMRARVLKRLNPHAPKSKVLVLGDSYMPLFSNYLSEVFGESIFVNLWDTQLDVGNRFPVPLIERLQPDLVILMFAERRIGSYDQRNQGYYYCVDNPSGIAPKTDKFMREGDFNYTIKNWPKIEDLLI